MVKAVICHSGGMDSSLCLALAIREFGKDEVISLSFDYGQTHSPELDQCAKICTDWDVKHVVLSLGWYRQITDNALINASLPISHGKDGLPNTLVAGRNGLMARISGILANHLDAHQIFMGVLELEMANSGYRDCSRDYMDIIQQALRIDFADPHFEIRTPVIRMTKRETLQLGHELGVLEYLLKETITCYRGVREWGCQNCPSCQLRNEGIRQFLQENPNFKLPYGVFQ